MPLAAVQIRSEYLAAAGRDESIATLSKLVGGMGEVTGPPKISRIDLFAAHWRYTQKTRNKCGLRNALKSMVAGDGIEPPTRGFSIPCSTN